MSTFPPPPGPPPPPGGPPQGGPPFPPPPEQPGGFPPSPPPPYGAGPPQSTQGPSPLPIVSLVVGIIAIPTSLCCIGLIAGIAAIVTGVIGRQQVAQRGGSMGMATAGIACGAVAIVLFIIIAILSASVNITST